MAGLRHGRARGKSRGGWSGRSKEGRKAGREGDRGMLILIRVYAIVYFNIKAEKVFMMRLVVGIFIFLI